MSPVFSIGGDSRQSGPSLFPPEPDRAETIAAKVLLLGDIGVGKSSLARRLVFDRFDADYRTTIGVDVFAHDVDLRGEGERARMRLVLWDTDGDYGNRIFETVYPGGASAAVIVADASRPATLAAMMALSDLFAARFPGRPIMRIVNKIDLAPQLAVQEPTAAGAYFSSAKTGVGVRELCAALAQELWRAAIEPAPQR